MWLICSVSQRKVGQRLNTDSTLVEGVGIKDVQVRRALGLSFFKILFELPFKQFNGQRNITQF